MRKNFSLKDIVKNHLLLVPGVNALARINHQTGANDSPVIVDTRFAHLSKLVDESFPARTDLKVIEFGPGQTSGVAIQISQKPNVSSMTVSDVHDYFPRNYWKERNVNFVDAQELSSQHVAPWANFAYCFDVLEHLRAPREFFENLVRILTGAGIFYASWDLRDHLNLNEETKWFDMHKYGGTAWNLGMSYRSSYVNRLQMNEWLEIFQENNFSILSLYTTRSTIAANSALARYNLNIDPVYRAEALLLLNG